MGDERNKKAWQSPKIQRIDIKRTMASTTGSKQDYLYKPTPF